MASAGLVTNVALRMGRGSYDGQSLRVVVVATSARHLEALATGRLDVMRGTGRLDVMGGTGLDAMVGTGLDVTVGTGRLGGTGLQGGGMVLRLLTMDRQAGGMDRRGVMAGTALQARDGMGRQQTVGAVGVRQEGPEDGEEGRKADGMGLLVVGGMARRVSGRRRGAVARLRGAVARRHAIARPLQPTASCLSRRTIAYTRRASARTLQGTASARWVTSAGLLTARWS